MLDVTQLSSRQLAAAVKLFDELAAKDLEPINEADKDSTRKELDERFARDVLGFPEAVTAPGGPLELLRTKLACEPSIKGGKKGTQAAKQKTNKIKSGTKPQPSSKATVTSEPPEEQEALQLSFDEPAGT